MLNIYLVQICFYHIHLLLEWRFYGERKKNPQNVVERRIKQVLFDLVTENSDKMWICRFVRSKTCYVIWAILYPLVMPTCLFPPRNSMFVIERSSERGVLCLCFTLHTHAPTYHTRMPITHNAYTPHTYITHGSHIHTSHTHTVHTSHVCTIHIHTTNTDTPNTTSTPTHTHTTWPQAVV